METIQLASPTSPGVYLAVFAAAVIAGFVIVLAGPAPTSDSGGKARFAVAMVVIAVGFAVLIGGFNESYDTGDDNAALASRMYGVVIENGGASESMYGLIAGAKTGSADATLTDMGTGAKRHVRAIVDGNGRLKMFAISGGGDNGGTPMRTTDGATQKSDYARR